MAAARLSDTRFIRFSSRVVNLEIGLVGFVSALLILPINWWGTGVVAWPAATLRLVLSLSYHLFLTKIAERLACLGSSHLGRLFWADLVPNTLFNLVQYPLFVLLGTPRPFWSLFPFWLFSMVMFSQIVKYGERGFEPGILDIVKGLAEDVVALVRPRR